MNPGTMGPDRLERFITAFTRLMDTQVDEPEILSVGRGLLTDLVSHDDWLPVEHARANPSHYQQYLLHLDPAGRFSVVSFVWGPGQFTPVHDHTVWGLVGVLRGAEVEQSYALSADGRWLPDGPEMVMRPGDVDAVSPRVGDVHQVSNALAGEVSVSIHVYGADIGAVRRHVYLPDGTRKPFISGYTNRPG